jgi:hypothetical protein
MYGNVPQEMLDDEAKRLLLHKTQKLLLAFAMP